MSLSIIHTVFSAIHKFSPMIHLFFTCACWGRYWLFSVDERILQYRFCVIAGVSLFDHCPWPCPPARDLVSRVSSLVSFCIVLALPCSHSTSSAITPKWNERHLLYKNKARMASGTADHVRSFDDLFKDVVTFSTQFLPIFDHYLLHFSLIYMKIEDQ